MQTINITHELKRYYTIYANFSDKIFSYILCI